MIRLDQFPLHLADQDHAHDVHDLRGGDPATVHELGGHVQPAEHVGDLRTATVHDDGLDAGELQEHDILGEGRAQGVVGHGVPAVLDDDGLPVPPLQPRQSSGQRGGGFDVGHVEYAEFSCT